MKKLFFVPLAALLICSCSPVSMITGSWKSPAANKKSYNSILVAALTSHAVAKATVEKDLAALLSKDNIHVAQGIEMFPPEASNSDSDRVRLMDKIKGKGIDAILTVSLLKKETESRYVNPGPYDPFTRYDYYGNFWGYYSYWYPYANNPDYYTEKVYYIETNLYDAKTEKLMWSAQSKTYELLDLPSFSQEFSKTIVKKLEDDGIVKGEERKEIR